MQSVYSSKIYNISLSVGSHLANSTPFWIWEMSSGIIAFRPVFSYSFMSPMSKIFSTPSKDGHRIRSQLYMRRLQGGNASAPHPRCSA